MKRLKRYGVGKWLIFICLALNLYSTYLLLRKEIKKPMQKDFVEKYEDEFEQPECLWPFLTPTHPSIAKWIQTPKQYNCLQLNPKLVEFDDNGYLYVLDERVNCYYREIRGALYPKSDKITFGPIFEVRRNGTKIGLKQFEVTCWIKSSEMRHLKNEIYRSAFVQISPLTKKFNPASQQRLSVDIIVLDSVSLNQFRRHMPKTYKYIKDKMGFLIFEKPGKVGDNTLPNMVALLTGLKVIEPEYIKLDNVTTDFLVKRPIEAGKDLKFVWEDFAGLGCATMLNSDPVASDYGFGFYPKNTIRGFRKPPTDYYFRPFYQYFNIHPIGNRTKRQPGCYDNRPAHDTVMRLLKQWFQAYVNTCHFSVTMALHDYTHNRPYDLELLDEVFVEFFESLLSNRLLKNSVLILMGDHGHRFGPIKNTPYGQIEERMAFFSIYFPNWFREKYPNVWQALKDNTNRPVTHWDFHSTIRSIIKSEFTIKSTVKWFGRGRSLFQPIPAERNCEEMQIPTQFCLCLVPLQNEDISAEVLDGLRSTLEDGLKISVKILNVTVYSTNNYVRAGVRHFDLETQLKLLKKETPPPIIFLWTVGVALDYQKPFQSEVMFWREKKRFDIGCIKIDHVLDVYLPTCVG